MKKILSLFGFLGLGSIPCINVISCGKNYIAINVANISSLDKMKEIKNLADIDKVNSKLADIVISGDVAGVKKMEAELNTEDPTAVIVTVTPAEGYYILDELDHFDIKNAISAPAIY